MIRMNLAFRYLGVKIRKNEIQQQKQPYKVILLPGIYDINIRVCVCNIWTDVQLLQGARGRIDGTGQRRPIYVVVQTYLQFSSLSSMATG